MSDNTDDTRHVDLVDTSQPLTRDLSKLVESCYIVEAELRHQVERLTDRVHARTESEARHTAQLAAGYREAYHNVRVLRRYHEGRLHRQRTTGTMAPVPDEADVGPVFGSKDDDPHGA